LLVILVMDVNLVKLLQDLLFVERDIASRALLDSLKDDGTNIGNRIELVKKSLETYAKINDQINYLNQFVQENIINKEKKEQ
jgi:hypothetical protein